MGVIIMPEEENKVIENQEDAQTIEPTSEETKPLEKTVYKTFESQADYDRAIQQAVKNNEEKAKKIAQKDLETRLKELEAQTERVKVEASKVAAKELLTEMGFAPSEFQDVIERFASADADATKESVKSFAERIKTEAEKIAQSKVQEVVKSTSIPKGVHTDDSLKTTEQLYRDAHQELLKNPNDSDLLLKVFQLKEKMR